MTENLKRVTGKIFAGNAPQTSVGQFGSALNGTKVNTTDIEQIQALPAYEDGWQSAVVTNRNYPTLEETNGLMKVISYQNNYVLQKGVPEWDSNTTYYSGDMCKGVGNGVLYVSRSDNNLNNPVSDATYWREYEGSAASIPATNYISEMAGDATFNGNAVTLPAMTMYIANGRTGDKSLVNEMKSITSSSYTVSGADGNYYLFYNNSDDSLLLAPNYTTRAEEEPSVGNTNDVYYGLDNKMYYVASTNPNYVTSAGVTVTESGIVSGLGSLSLNFDTALPANPTLNLNFTTGTDIQTAQSLFSTPYAVGSIANGALGIDIYSFAYGVNYYPIIYTGAYTLNSSETLYSYTLGNTMTYTASALQLGLVLYTDKELQTPYGTVTALTGDNTTVSQTTSVYDGAYSLVTSDDYYTYLMGSTNYYTSSPLANGVTVYTDSALSNEFGVAFDVTDSTVLIQEVSNIYTGIYTTNPDENIYTYTIGETTVYSTGVLIPGLIVYTDESLLTPYGIVERITTSNVVIHEMTTSSGYVAINGSGLAAVNTPIYSDVDLTTQVATSTGANTSYTGTSAKSSVGVINFDLTASTAYSGTLTFTSNSYNLVLNSLSTSLLSSRLPFVDQQPAISLGGTNGFSGTFNLAGTSMPNVWTWNGFNVTSPDWVEASLCELGNITLSGGNIEDLHIHYPIELVKMSDLESLKITPGGGGTGSGFNLFDTVVKDHILSFEESKGFALQGTYVYKEAVAGSRYGYPDFYNKCIEEKTAGVATETTLGDNTITMYNNLNGHIFYDIADKSAVDEWFETYGSAWFYGVDTVNERIFLPRNKLIEQFTGDTTELNKLIEAGLPNITGEYYGIYQDGVMGAEHGAHYSGAFYKARGASRRYASSSTAGYGGSLGFDASLSNPIYGNSDTVQPPTIQRLLYIVVGNTEVSEAQTEVTEVTTTENDTIPLFTSMYQDNLMNSVSWLRSQGQWNSAEVYPTAYNELVNALTNNPRNLPVVENTAAYTDYDFVVNQTDMTFRLPLLDGSESLDGSVIESVSLPSSGSTIVAKKNGAFNLTTTNSANLTLKNLTSGFSNSDGINGNSNISISIDVKKGDIVEVSWVNGSPSLTFTAFIGNGNLYFKVANAVENLELLDAGAITEELTNKVSFTDTEFIASQCVPDYSAGVTISATTFTAPANGLISLVVQDGDVSTTILTRNGVSTTIFDYGTYPSDTQSTNFPVLAGDSLQFANNSRNPGRYFYPFIGGAN